MTTIFVIGTTVIEHDQSRTADLEPKSKPGEAELDITYRHSLEQMSALAAVSAGCQQYIKKDCYDSIMWDDWPYGWWISRHGKDMHNFGGVPTGEEGCACSLTEEGRFMVQAGS